MPQSKKRRGTRNKINSNHSIYDLSKFTVWVIRLPGDSNLRDKGILRDAAPCARCCKGLYRLGFTKLGFSNINGDLEIADLRHYQNTHLSGAQKITEKYCKFIQ